MADVCECLFRRQSYDATCAILHSNQIAQVSVVKLKCVRCVCVPHEHCVLARIALGRFPPLGWSLIGLSVCPILSYIIYCSFYLAAAVSLSVHPSHSKPSLLIWTQPKNRSVVSASQLQSPPIYYSLEHSRADGPREGHVVAQLTRRCQTLMHYHDRTEKCADSATRSPQ